MSPRTLIGVLLAVALAMAIAGAMRWQAMQRQVAASRPVGSTPGLTVVYFGANW